MKQITIRDIPEEIARDIKKEAKKKNLSLNKAFIFILERATGKKARRTAGKTAYHDLDHLFGIWSKKDAQVFDKNLASQREIDKDLWKKAG
jgi:hypothetical protein